LSNRSWLTKPSSLSRRSFVGASLSLASAVAAGDLLTGCSNAVVETSSSTEVPTGEWKTGACWHNCGGRCLNKVFVQDGVVIRQKTDDNHEDSPDWPQQRGCLRGRSQRKQVFAADRLKYPMKRKHWQPDQPNGELRGSDDWERISWDEALDYIADGLQSAKASSGNRSIVLDGADESDNAVIARTLGLFGGYTETWNTNSFGGWIRTPFIIGFHHGGKWDQTVNDRFDLRNCETIVMLSMNPSWSALGSQTLNYWEAKKAGANFICIDPFYNDTYALLDAKWLPVRPATDTAFLLGLAYSMLDQDGDQHLIDWDFLNRCTVGFDSEHMPADAKENINFKDYVLGAYDGVAKTPEWAEKICGIPAADIRQLATQMGKDHKVAFICGMASARTHNSDSLPQLIMTIGAMGGHMGKSGHMTGSTMHATSGNGGPALIQAGKDGVDAVPNLVDDSINGQELPKAIIEGKYTWTGKGAIYFDTQMQPGQERDIDIKVVYHGRSAGMQTVDETPLQIEAAKKPDMIVAHAQFFTANACYSDIVLPITTEWENHAAMTGGTLVHSSNREMMVVYQNIVAPLYEAKSEGWIAVELGKRLGLAESDLAPISEDQAFFNKLASMKKIDSDGKTLVNAVKLTKQDIQNLGAEGNPQDGALEWTELEKAGVYQVKRQQGDNYGYIAFKDFRDDPDANPLDTPSGKLEIYCQTLADKINGMGFSKILPIPSYIEVEDGYTKTFDDWDSQVKGEFDKQMICLKYPRRAHTVFDNVPWLREAWANPVFLSQQDAQESNISDGDTVLVSSPYGGKVIRKACVTGRLRPGVVGVPHGAWPKFDEATGIDVAGCDNTLTHAIPTGCGVSGFNSNIVKIEKYDGEQLADDVQQALRIPLKDGE